MKDLKNIYLYLVSIISLIVTLVASYTFVSTLIKDVFLDLTPSYMFDMPRMVEGDEKPTNFEEMKMNRKNDIYSRLIDNAVVLAFFAPTFVYHYKKTDLYKKG